MTDSKKKRMSMLDNLAAAGASSPPAPMMSSNRALRAARDAVDSHHVWELDPETIDDTRMADRLDPADVADLRDAIEQNGQAVPILVRRHPSDTGRYLLVYGRRRLEAIRRSNKVSKVRALVASLDDDTALRTQISENMARRDLSFIERALFARELIDSGFGNQNQVAEVFTVTKSSVSMALAILDVIGADLAQAIGPAHGIGRPRWEALSRAIETHRPDMARLVAAAEAVHDAAAVAPFEGDSVPEDPSTEAFEAVARLAGQPPKPAAGPKAPAPRPLVLDGKRAGSLKSTPKSVSIVLDRGDFASWVEAEGQTLIEDLHARWKARAED